MPLERRADVDAIADGGGLNTREEDERGKDEEAESLDEAGTLLVPEAADSHSQMAIRRLRDTDDHIRRDTKRQMLELEESRRYNDTESDEVIEDEGLDDSPGASYDRAAARSPPVNSSYLPIPWHGRLGYGPLNTYLRAADNPVFNSRTCGVASMIDHRYPLRKPSQPEHPITNRPDRSKEPDVALGERFIKGMSLENIRDIVKMVRWNDKYNIKFMRLSSGMCPFASDGEHGYKLEPFATGVLAEAGKVITELGHRVTTHPGPYTQLGSPEEAVVAASIRELEYHDEMLSLLNLPARQDRDAVIILHMDPTLHDKEATLDRFRHNYTTRLLPSARARLVLENDDVSWGVHDLLPICEELSIPLMLDFHHHNIVFDASRVREGTLDVSESTLRDRISATWTRKGIKQSMHYSEARPGAVTARERRKHANRVVTLPPCAPDTDLLIGARDEEQAVFELMRNFKLPGFEKINDMIPRKRQDENRISEKGGTKRERHDGGRFEDEDEDMSEDESEGDGEYGTQSKEETIPPEEVAMGGPRNRVFWPVGRRDWVTPKKGGLKKGTSLG